jgi:hypothetical protein
VGEKLEGSAMNTSKRDLLVLGIILWAIIIFLSINGALSQQRPLLLREWLGVGGAFVVLLSFLWAMKRTKKR